MKYVLMIIAKRKKSRYIEIQKSIWIISFNSNIKFTQKSHYIRMATIKYIVTKICTKNKSSDDNKIT